jgi:hypothetical protein
LEEASEAALMTAFSILIEFAYWLIEGSSIVNSSTLQSFFNFYFKLSLLFAMAQDRLSSLLL